MKGDQYEPCNNSYRCILRRVFLLLERGGGLADYLTCDTKCICLFSNINKIKDMKLFYCNTQPQNIVFHLTLCEKTILYHYRRMNMHW